MSALPAAEEDSWILSLKLAFLEAPLTVKSQSVQQIARSVVQDLLFLIQTMTVI